MANIPYITADNAAELQRRAIASRLAAKSLVLSDADRQAIANKFQEERLARVRKQLETIQGLIDSEMAKGGECDPGALDRLTNAAGRLEEQERRWSNRSLPPTLKASQPKTKRSASADPEPE
jgi:hypothetical protein